jgi:TetR/AcrR family transcriptional repressor of nem operon
MPEKGCAIGALVSDVGRADDACRGAMSERIEGYIASMSASLGGDEAKAMTAVSAMVGALALSRVMTDPKRSDAILRAAREAVLAMETA